MSTDRLPPLPDDALTAEQRAVAERIVAGPRGRLGGPFVPVLHSPQAAEHLQALGAYLRFGCGLPARVFELAVLLVARHRDQGFEWAHHEPLARAAGLPDEVIAAIAADERPTGLTDAEVAAYDLVTEALRGNDVAQRTYERAVAQFGERGVVELVVTAGYYTTLAMVMNLARTPVPPGAPVLPARNRDERGRPCPPPRTGCTTRCTAPVRSRCSSCPASAARPGAGTG
ncbi:4-carboxymuconolactone decarboxylase [Pseudonocardia thermophila]|uniref:4-carboxymuconolactone decarboxylase n=1 Tax=Pseudonocardia thermophila TaxID=1848 RepID=A0A1M6PLZ9_PSETH|nr:carboxymuconolactone decarboxylase family protein [Pseudonocardia thermophila]SHK08931.1 4-carboxymuconolactone decarboxylase [Pseudonocardia thermophila]